MAALMVVAAHSRGENWVEAGRLAGRSNNLLVEAFFAATRPGVEWVIVFFVLSGFLVAGKIMERVLHKTFDVRSYIIDRSCRIWVPLIPACLFTAVSALYCGYPVSILSFLGNVFGLQGVLCDTFGHNVPLWSLSYEIWFYVLAGFAAVIVMRPPHRLWLWLGLAVSFAVFTKLAPYLLFCWLMGAFAYFLISEKNSIAFSILGPALCILGIVIGQLDSDSRSMTNTALLPYLPSRNAAGLIESVGIGLFLADVCRRRPHSSSLAQVEHLGTSLAAFSYTLYLIHYPVLDIWEHILGERYTTVDFFSLMMFFGKVLSCLLAGFLFYLPFEAQTEHVKKWLKGKFFSKHGVEPALAAANAPL